MGEGEQRDRAEFNMAVSYLNRLNALLMACDEASIRLDVYMWFHSLLAIFRELSSWMKQPEIDGFNADIIKINPLIKQVYDLNTRTGRMEINNELYMQLHELELELRQVISKSKLLMKVADDAYDALK